MTEIDEFNGRAGWRVGYDLADRLIHAAGIARDSRVIVAGAGSLELLVGLCRHGFSNVSCLRLVQPLAENGADALLVPGFDSLRELRALIGRFAGELRAGGVAAIALEGRASSYCRTASRLLHKLGFTGIRRKWAPDGTFCVLCCRRDTAFPLPQAA